MTKQDRLSEILFSIDLLPDDADIVEATDLSLPNGTDGIDEDMGKALICQSIKEDHLWANKLYVVLCNTAMNSVMERGEILAQDLVAFATAANVAWAHGVGNSAMEALGLLSTSAQRSEAEVPDLAFAFFKNPDIAQSLSERNPYEYIS